MINENKQESRREWMIKAFERAGLTGDPNKPFVFGFKENTELSSEAEDFCNKELHNYFPTCELLLKMN